MDGGVHKRTGQNLGSFAFFPAEWAIGVLNEVLAVLVDHGQEGVPVVKLVFIDLVPKVSRAGWANAKPKRCGPNVLLRTQIDSDLHDIVHEVDQLS